MVRSRKNERIVLLIREKVVLDKKMGGCYFECGKLNFLSRSIMVTYGDGVADIDIEKLLEFHQSHGKIATVTGVRPRFLRFGELNIQEDQVIRFAEKPEYQGNYVNGGFFVFNRVLFDYLEDRDDCDLEVGPLDQISQNGELMVYKHDRFWSCMDTIRDTEYLNNLWNNNQAEWKIW